MNDANKKQSSQALTIQAYCNSILQQQKVDFSYDDSLVKYQNQINNFLASAQGNADNYINTLLPQIIDNISNINNYCDLHTSVPDTIPENGTAQQWNEAIAALIEVSLNYSTTAFNLSNLIKSFAENIDTDAGDFSIVVTNLNSAVSGDNGVLDSNKKQIESLQSKIAGEEAGIAISFIGIIGGIIQIFVGAFADVVTGGASVGLVISGSITLAGGIAGESAALVELVADTKLRGTLISEDTQLTSEVKIAQGVATGYSGLGTRVRAASACALAMANAWSLLNSELNTLSKNLTTGLQNTGEIRNLFLAGANKDLQQIIETTGIIENQMTGVSIVTAPPGQTLYSILPSYS
ncbi:HBL/NHE enterotoxin family protein [Pseudomonas sp. QD4]|uniref:HBL/NHE enterotoxin family protein n=1 Tax=Pseudomonas sp. QD4 TaxID=3368618 RepID=UPI003BA2BB13